MGRTSFFFTVSVAFINCSCSDTNPISSSTIIFCPFAHVACYIGNKIWERPNLPPTSSASPAALGIILNTQATKHSCFCFMCWWKKLGFSTALCQCLTHRLELCITGPQALPLQHEFALLPTANICISLPEGFLPNSRKPIWPQHSRLDRISDSPHLLILRNWWKYNPVPPPSVSQLWVFYTGSLNSPGELSSSCQYW